MIKPPPSITSPNAISAWLFSLLPVAGSTPVSATVVVGAGATTAAAVVVGAVVGAAVVVGASVVVVVEVVVVVTCAGTITVKVWVGTACCTRAWGAGVRKPCGAS